MSSYTRCIGCDEDVDLDYAYCNDCINKIFTNHNTEIQALKTQLEACKADNAALMSDIDRIRYYVNQIPPTAGEVLNKIDDIILSLLYPQTYTHPGQELLDRLKRYEEALQVYADDRNWKGYVTCKPHMFVYVQGRNLSGYDLAQQALKKEAK